MDIVNNLLFWLHLSGLAMGGTAAFAMPLIGRQMASATPETRPVLFAIGDGISSVARAGLGILIITGPLLAWLKFGFAGFTFWFTIQMVLVVLLLASVVYSGIMAKRAQGGDRAAAGMMPRLGAANLVLLLGIVLAAVFAFN